MIKKYLSKAFVLFKNPKKAKYIPSFLKHEYIFWRGKRKKKLDGYSAIFNVTSETEYGRLNNFKDEKYVIREILKEIKDGGVFYDIGANIGTHSAFIGNIPETKVYGFEPFPANFKSLEKNFEYNNINGNVFQVALMNKTSQMSLTTESGESGEGTNHISEKGDIEVETFRGDDFIEKEDLEKPDIMKIDVEGAEFEVLKGFEKTLQDSDNLKLFIELHPDRIPDFGESKENLLSFLKSSGFSIKEISARGGENHIKAAKIKQILQK